MSKDEEGAEVLKFPGDYKPPHWYDFWEGAHDEATRGLAEQNPDADAETIASVVDRCLAISKQESWPVYRIYLDHLDRIREGATAREVLESEARLMFDIITAISRAALARNE